MEESFKTYLNAGQRIIQILANDSAIKEVRFVHHVEKEIPNPLLKEAAKQLTSYFKSDLKQFDLPLEPDGTAFQQKVWKLLQKIPYGKTWTYASLAEKLGDPKTIRAAANANGKNPIPILIPCHRVIGTDGSLTGYSGGLENKKWLLTLENANGVLSLFP
jgi:methylated-DNA-[protein]-cysteine S-methyltransferase